MLAVSPLRVLQVVSSGKNSGAERHVYLLTQMLRRRGHEVSVVCPPGGWLREALQADDVCVYPMEMRGPASLRAHGALLGLINKSRFDLVHTHLTRATYHGGPTALLRGVPVVSTIHVYSRDFVYRLLAARGARLIAVSQSVRQALLKAGIADRCVDVVYNGTDFIEDDPFPAQDNVWSEFGLTGNEQLIGLVGRVSKEKGHLVALRAARVVAKDHASSHFLFVGRVEPHFRVEFETALEASGVRDRITLTGDRTDVPRLMDAMDIVMLPSEKETFGLVAIEAMARGKPVIATRVGGLMEVIQDQRTGLLIAQDDAELAAAIGSLLRDPARRLAMGENGRAWVRENFSHTQMVERVEAVYERAIGPQPMAVLR